MQSSLIDGDHTAVIITLYRLFPFLCIILTYLFYSAVVDLS